MRSEDAEEAHISGLVSDQPPSGNAVLRGISDAERTSPSPTLLPPTAPASQEGANSMSDPFSDSGSCRLTSHAIPESPRETLSQPEGISRTLERAHTTDPIIPPTSSSEDSSYSAGSNRGCEDPPASSSTQVTLESCPLLVPLPESDVEGEDSSDFERSEGARSAVNSESQMEAAHTTHTDERTNASSGPDIPNVVRPSGIDDYQALWVLGDSVLERRDRRVYERWKAALGVTFVLSNILSVLILCIAIELYRRTKAAHPGLISKIRARHIARRGRNSPFSPIVSLFFEPDAPFVHSNTAFLAGLCTTLTCTLMSDIALRWVARFESRLPPQSATPRDRMIARMEWNERMERRAVPWLLDIGIPGLLYIALSMFFMGAIMRAFPYLNRAISAAFGVLFMAICIRILWSFEPALDVRFRPKPVSSMGR